MNELKEQVSLNLQEVRKKKSQFKKYAGALNYLGSILLPSVIILIIFNVIIGIAGIKGDSMNNGLHDGDIVIYNRLSTKYDYLDIIVARKKDDNKLIIKRIIGLPYDEIDIKDGYVYVNGVMLNEAAYSINGTTELKDISFPIKLKENEYFLLGDNRTVSLDSRSSETGNILKENILGKVFFVSRFFK